MYFIIKYIDRILKCYYKKAINTNTNLFNLHFAFPEVELEFGPREVNKFI